MEANICASGCGFYGSAATDSLCSVCFKKQIKRLKPTAAMFTCDQSLKLLEKDEKAFSIEENQTESKCKLHLFGEPFTSAQVAQIKKVCNEYQKTSEDEEKLKKINRYSVCYKKVGLLRFYCRCGGLYCAVHKYNDEHNCTFDYKKHGEHEVEGTQFLYAKMFARGLDDKQPTQQHQTDNTQPMAISQLIKIANSCSLLEKQKYIADYSYPHCDEVFKYEIVAKIGQGTFGEVFKAREKKNNEKFVAMKKVLMENEKEGFPITALRELKILKLLKHENIINLIEICHTQATASSKYCSTFFLVFDFCEHDLAGLLFNDNVKFSLGDIKKVMQQLLNALYFMHFSKILHRDIKSPNVLITKHGVLKLADFGLARAFSIPRNDAQNCFTKCVVTLWYRPPEILLGDRNYGPPVDMWGAACIMAEMWLREPIMQATSEHQQLNYISQLCGSITPHVWPGVEKLELYQTIELPKYYMRHVIKRFKPFVKDPHACDLLDKLFTLDPKKRIDADTALNHDFFWTDPMPSDLSEMLSQHSESMFDYSAQPRRSNPLRFHYKKPLTTKQKPPESTSHFDRIW